MSSITDGTIEKPSSTAAFAKKTWNFLKSYVSNVGSVYLEFAVPFALIAVFTASEATQFRDPQRMGLLWMRYASTEDELTREREFPAFTPGSYAHTKRISVMSANEAAAHA